jgi:phage baseplate assembly protein W
MSQFDQPLPSYRLVETYYADDLEAVAARYMGDANRWSELVWINNLVPPYITDDPDMVAAGVLLSGSFIKVPAATGFWTDQAETGQVYERDIAMANRQLQIDGGGDFSVVAGVDNLRQQLKNRIATPSGQLRRHQDYGCKIYRLRGAKNTPTANKLGADYVKASLLGDYRVSSVDNVVATLSGDVINVQARAIAIEGSAVDIIQGGS